MPSAGVGLDTPCDNNHQSLLVNQLDSERTVIIIIMKMCKINNKNYIHGVYMYIIL